MGYAKDFKYTVRKLSENVVIASAPHQVGHFNLGARMAVLQHDDNIIIWSAMPNGPAVVDSLKLLTGRQQGFNVTHIIVPNKEHTLGPQTFKDVYPKVKIIAIEKVQVSGVKPDIVIPEKYGNKVLSDDVLRAAGITDKVLLENFEFVALTKHKNSELVVYDKTSKTVFESDLLVNTGAPGQVSEQYSPANGFAKGYNPNSGWSFLTRYMQPKSTVGGLIARSLARVSESKEGLKAIDSWDFTRIVPSHGNVIDIKAKDAFRSVFKKAL